MPARGDHVRLGDAVGGGGSPGGEVGQDVVAEPLGAAVVDRADGHHERVVAGLGDGARAAVGGRHDHRDAGVPGPLDRVVEGVARVGLGGVGAQREVEHADVVGVPEGDHPLHAASTLETSAVPSAPAILTERILAPGAAPFQRPPESAPLPAMVPAMNVPWP